jgi:hypothetical protein
MSSIRMAIWVYTPFSHPRKSDCWVTCPMIPSLYPHYTPKNPLYIYCIYIYIHILYIDLYHSNVLMVMSDEISWHIWGDITNIPVYFSNIPWVSHCPEVYSHDIPIIFPWFPQFPWGDLWKITIISKSSTFLWPSIGNCKL